MSDDLPEAFRPRDLGEYDPPEVYYRKVGHNETLETTNAAGLRHRLIATRDVLVALERAVTFKEGQQKLVNITIELIDKELAEGRTVGKEKG